MTGCFLLSGSPNGYVCLRVRRHVVYCVVAFVQTT